MDFVHIRPAFWYDKERDQEMRDSMRQIWLECELAKEAVAGTPLQVFAVSDKFDGYWTPRGYDRCLAVLTGTCLTATGDFAVCQDRTDLRFGEKYAADNGEDQSFEEIWQSQAHKDLVNSIVDPGTLKACPRCVWNNRNTIIDEVFVKDSMRLELP